MKKKIYFAPETTTVEIELQQLIALSKHDDPADGTDALSRQGDFEEEDDDWAGPHRRSRRSAWDDEEELDGRDDRW